MVVFTQLMKISPGKFLYNETLYLLINFHQFLFQHLSFPEFLSRGYIPDPKLHNSQLLTNLLYFWRIKTYIYSKQDLYRMILNSPCKSLRGRREEFFAVLVFYVELAELYIFLPPGSVKFNIVYAKFHYSVSPLSIGR